MFETKKVDILFSTCFGTIVAFPDREFSFIFSKFALFRGNRASLRFGWSIYSIIFQSLEYNCCTFMFFNKNIITVAQYFKNSRERRPGDSKKLGLRAHFWTPITWHYLGRHMTSKICMECLVALQKYLECLMTSKNNVTLQLWRRSKIVLIKIAMNNTFISDLTQLCK